MRKFFVILKKEIRELLTPQIVIPLLISILFFAFIGKLVGTETKKASSSQAVIVLDNDNSSASSMVVRVIKDSGFKVKVLKGKKVSQAVHLAEKKGINVVITIPEGFEKNLESFKKPEVETYVILRSFSLGATRVSQDLKIALSVITNALSNQRLISVAPGIDPSILKSPIHIKESVIVGNRYAEASAEQILGFITSQTAFIPIILTLIIVFSSQMIATAIASEKENKTLETLLSLPVKRGGLVTAKMVAAGLIALAAAAVYIFGFRYYMEGITGSEFAKVSSGVISSAIRELGLILTPSSYILLGTSLFFGILCALSISIILGAFADDVKGVQAILTPLMILVLIPYFLLMFLDLNTVSPVIKYVILAIPFSHPFMAASNLFLKNYLAVYAGILYQAIFFLIFAFIASRILSSDKILTMKLKMKKEVTS